jgi:hypothetical protein
MRTTRSLQRAPLVRFLEDHGVGVTEARVIHPYLTPHARFMLSPRQAVVFDAGNIAIAKSKEGKDNLEHMAKRGVHRILTVAPGDYQLQLTARFGGIAEMRSGPAPVDWSSLPADWTGVHETAPIEIVIERSAPEATKVRLPDADNGSEGTHTLLDLASGEIFTCPGLDRRPDPKAYTRLGKGDLLFDRMRACQERRQTVFRRISDT